jgi:hypothetical protein
MSAATRHLASSPKPCRPSSARPRADRAIEQLLLQLEDDPDDRELLDALFRCAHTVKGSAGIFGLDRWWPSRTTWRPCSTACAKASCADARAQHAAAAVQRPDPRAGGRPAGRRSTTRPRGEATRAMRWCSGCAHPPARTPRPAPGRPPPHGRAAPDAPAALAGRRCASAPTPSATAWTRWPSCATWRPRHGSRGACDTDAVPPLDDLDPSPATSASASTLDTDHAPGDRRRVQLRARRLRAADREQPAAPAAPPLTPRARCRPARGRRRGHARAGAAARPPGAAPPPTTTASSACRPTGSTP